MFFFFEKMVILDVSRVECVILYEVVMYYEINLKVDSFSRGPSALQLSKSTDLIPCDFCNKSWTCTGNCGSLYCFLVV